MAKFDEIWEKKDEAYAEEAQAQAKEDLRLDFDTAINSAKRQVTNIKREIDTLTRSVVLRKGDTDLRELAIKTEGLDDAKAILARLEAMKVEFLD